MRHEYQNTAVQQIHAVLEAHVQLLDQVTDSVNVNVYFTGVEGRS